MPIKCEYAKYAPEKLYENSVKRIEEYAHLGKADLHIHSNYSDAKPSIEVILEYVQHKTDLDVIAITDHDCIEGALKAVRIAKRKKYRFEVIVGEEISTTDGHILGLFLTEKIEPNQTVKETLKQIREQGGVSIASHPFYHTRINGGDMPIMDGIGLVTLLKEKEEINGIETVNANPMLGKQNFQANVLNSAALFMADVGGSDAHILQAIGMGWTVFEGKTAGDLKEALLHNQTAAVSKRWRFIALMRYAYFFLPKSLRLVFFTIVHGRRPKRQSHISF
ncbi:MAG: PHP domain protein [bacterium ADurb.Bin400]|nr:MAG: PHP domain protein [bacterium ADurb.Bin400]